MESPAPLLEWAIATSVLRNQREPIATDGDRRQPFEWASVSKLAVAAVVGCRVQTGEMHFDEVVGPDETTLAHLLSHSSGLGPSRGSLGARIGTKRIYSSYAYERVVEHLGGVDTFVLACKSELGLTSVTSDGTAAGGLIGSLVDMESLAWVWMGQGQLDSVTVDTMSTTYLPELAGVVPGFGPFDPCPWGLGPQVKGGNHHWMGEGWSPRSFGHFGQSGSMLLIDPESLFAVVAASPCPFGQWAVAQWPRWTSGIHELAQ